jgi:hypothetical protein
VAKHVLGQRTHNLSRWRTCRNSAAVSAFGAVRRRSVARSSSSGMLESVGRTLRVSLELKDVRRRTPPPREAKSFCGWASPS